jgi:hypothetical protein
MAMRELTADEIKYFYKDAYKFWKLHLVNNGSMDADNEIDYKQAFEGLLNLLHRAYVVYHKDGRRQDDRAREVLRILGFTNGTRQEKVKKDELLIEYKVRIEMVSNPPATNKERQQIIDSMAKKHGMNAAALHKHLRVVLAALRRTISEMKTLKEINPAQCEELTEMYKKLLPPHD